MSIFVCVLREGVGSWRSNGDVIGKRKRGFEGYLHYPSRCGAKWKMFRVFNICSRTSTIPAKATSGRAFGRGNPPPYTTAASFSSPEETFE